MSVSVNMSVHFYTGTTRCVHGLEEHHVQITLIFSRIIIFTLFTVLLLLMYFVSKNF